ncbi:MAG: polysaccharide deacetylase family protein [Bacillota bacterium]|nr:polysaccharide deacetylase family protein [Bacillota bacterium]
MHTIYLSRRGWKLRLTYLFACSLMLCTAVLFLSETEVEPTLAEAYRCGPAESSRISLAINVDWGEEFLPAMLQTLAEEDVKASFFLSGRWTELQPELAAEIAAAGHEIGNHGFSHSSPNASSREEVREEIHRAGTAILKATGQQTSLYAPPSGECEPHVLEAAEQSGHKTILWSVDTIDWQKPDPATILQRVKSKIHGGAIILAHPTESTAEILGQMIKELKAEGYCFVTVSENISL